MARQMLEGQLKRITSVTPTMRELVIKATNPNNFKFKAGQFVMIQVPQKDKPAQRAYSIASSENISDEYKLIIKLVPDGVASEYIRNLKDKDPIQFTGPFGKCFFKTPAPKQVVLLSTGAGLSQHYSFLMSEGPKFPNTEFHTLVGVWNETEMFYQKEIEEAKKTVKNLTCEFVLDKPQGSWKGKTGFVTNYLASFNLMEKPSNVYLCGNPAMIKGVKDELEKMGFPKESVIAESFG